jgi:hypothetical protein
VTAESIRTPSGRTRTIVVFLAAWATLTLGRLDAAVFADADAAMHVRLGLAIASARAIPAEDPVLTPAATFVDHEWLSDLIMAAIWWGLGWTGLALGTNAIAALILAWAHERLARQQVHWLLRAFLLVALVAALVSHLTARPHLATWLAVTAFLALCGPAGDNVASAPKRIGIMLAMLAVLWANLHGGVLLGPPLLCALLLQRRLHGHKIAHLVWIPAAIALASLANPWGIHLPLHLWHFLLSNVVRATSDFQATALASAAGVAAVMWTTLAVIAAYLGRAHASSILWLALWSAFAWISARNVAIAALCLVPTVGALFATYLPASRLSRLDCVHLHKPLHRRLAITAAASACAIALIFAWVRPPQPTGLVEPMAAIAALPEIGHGPIFTTLHWGGWVALDRPRLRLFVHPLTANYLDRDERYATYLRLWNTLPGWRRSLDELGFVSVLVAPQAPLAAALQADGWLIRHADSRAILLARPPRKMD